MTRARSLLILLAIAMGIATPAFAQNPPQGRHWGVTASVAPWRAGTRSSGLYFAKDLDFTGGSRRIGITKGSARGNEWALVYIRRTINEGGTIVDNGGRKFEVGPNVKLTGFMAEQFGSFGTIARRVQIGVVVAGGLARAEGVLRAVPSGAEHEASQMLTLFAREVDFQLLLRGELAVAVIVAPGMKIRFSGGFDWPGTSVVGVTAMYFFGDR